MPFVASQMAENFSVGQQAHLYRAPGVFFASVIPIHLSMLSLDYTVLFIPLAILAFLTVCMACHAINVLVFLCPFGFIDALLKFLKLALLSSVVLSYAINPYFGAAVSLLVLVIATFVAPWAFRLTVFGTFLAADIITPARFRRSVTPTEARGFLARPVLGVSTRTYGHLARADDGTVLFHYRRWLVLPRTSVKLPPGPTAISKGLLFPSLLHSHNDIESPRILVMFMPRYRSHEEVLARHFEITNVMESPLTRGFKAVRGWIAEVIIGRNPKNPDLSTK